MQKDIPYSELKKNERAYEIMLLRDQYENTFSAIADVYGLAVPRVASIYRKMKLKQMHLYFNHIAIVLGHNDVAQVANVFADVYECYQDMAHACAYMEQKYHDILMKYRHGEPGMPEAFVKRLPPFRERITQEELTQVIYMREVEHASFQTIAKELGLTRAKAKKTYQMFYHDKVIKMVKALQEKAKSREEEREIWECYFHNSLSPKKRYEMLCEEMNAKEP